MYSAADIRKKKNNKSKPQKTLNKRTQPNSLAFICSPLFESETEHGLNFIAEFKKATSAAIFDEFRNMRDIYNTSLIDKNKFGYDYFEV